MIKGPFPVEGIEEVWSQEPIRRIAPNGLSFLAARLRKGGRWFKSNLKLREKADASIANFD